MPTRRGRFYQVLTEAIADFTAHGFDSQERLDYWLKELRQAATQALIPEAALAQQLRDALGMRYRRAVDGGGLLRSNPGVERFTIQKLKPSLHAELQRRIFSSANLIKLNREASLQKTLQRLAGWASSIPAGGSKTVDKRDTKDDIRRGIAGLPFEERRVIVDQGMKLVAALNEIVATDGGAIAFIWRHVKERAPAYDARPDHVARDGKLYVIRGNWAIGDGLMKLAGHQYYDEITAAAQEPFCRCSTEGVYALRDLPAEMLTEKGRAALERGARAA